MKKLFIVPIILFNILNAIELKVATYNVDNLFDLVYNKTEYKDYIPNMHNWNRSTFEKKLNNITKVICELNADVIGLQEIENKNALELLQKNLRKYGCKYPYSAITNKKTSAIEVALLSKIPIKKRRDIVVSNYKRDRNILEVELKTTPKLTIFVNHWRSQKADEKERVKYAKALVNRIKKMPKNSEYIILGDFNSQYNECIKESNSSKICGIDRILKTYYKGRLIKLRDKPPLSFYHYNLWSEIAAHKRWSYDFFGQKSAFDSIIIPKTLNDNKDWFYKKGSFKVFKKSYLFIKNKNLLNRWEYKHSKHTGKGYSDHLPLIATFTTGSKELKHESLIDKFWKLILPTKVAKNESNKTKQISFNRLLKKKYLKAPVILKDVCVVFKRGDIGVIKASFNSKSITLYKSAEGLEEGRCYDFKVYKKKRYYGIEEITDLDVLAKKGRIDIEKYIPKFTHKLMQKDIDNIGEIVKDIRGIYNKGFINVDGNNYRLYVKKKKRGVLKKGSKLYIKKAQIGYYKKEKELIVYSTKDIIKEN